MTRVSASYVNNTVGNATGYQAFQGAVSTALNTIFTRSTDTGQIASFNITPTSASRDYEVFRLTDSLQATAPIYVRLDYQVNTATLVYMTVTVGTSTNGAGVLGGITTPVLALHGITPAANATRFLYASTDGSQLVFMSNLQAQANPGGDALAGFIVERTRDADGTPNAAGYMLYHFKAGTEPGTGGYGQVSLAGVYPRINDATVTQPPAGFDIAATAPNLANATSYLIGSTAYALPAYGFGYQMMGASKALMAGFPGDFAKETPTVLTHYGTQMTYLPLPQCGLGVPYNGSTGAAVRTMCPLVRWE